MESTGTSGAATTGPATFADADWSTEAPSASTPSPESTPQPSASADTTVPPAVGSPGEASPQQPGEPPRERWDAILENARTKARDEALQGYQGVTPDTVQQMAHWYGQFHANPVAFVQQIVGEMQQHPEYGAQLRSLAARTLAAARGQQAQTGPDLSQVVIDLGNGTQVPLSDLEGRIAASLEQKFAPKFQTVEQLQQREAAQAAQIKADQFASTTFAELAKQPGFQEHKAEIGKVLAGMRLTSDEPAAVEAAALKAYMQVVLPHLGKNAEAKLLDSLQQKAHASTVNPGGAATSAPPKDVRDFNDPRLQWR